MVQPGSHLATYFSTEAGRLRIAVPFLREGISLGQPCFLIANGKVLDRYIKALEKDVKAELAEARRCGLFATAPTPVAPWRKLWLFGTRTFRLPFRDTAQRLFA